MLSFILAIVFVHGIRGLVNEVIRDYLTNRKQYVHANGVSSSLENINIGVQQGSVLGPILFLIYINDIVTVIVQILMLLCMPMIEC